MSPLRQSLERYLEVRRSVGYKLQALASRLRSFAAFLEQAGSPRITTELALQWARQPSLAQPETWAARLAMVRLFAKWHSAVDPRTQVPPDGLLRHPYRRKPPYIYSDEEIESLLDAAAGLPSPKGLRGCSCATLFGLLAVTGVRVGEALGLDRKDVDLGQGVLAIRRGKFGKSRLVPVHPSTLEALRTYAARRDEALPASFSSAFFLSEGGRRITYCMVEYAFARISRQTGLRPVGRRRGPRLHDMRHRFAVRTLIDWYRAGLDVERELPKLSAYLGHARVKCTYWYLEAVPELLQLAAERLMEQRKEDRP